jgi:hypothetical protein
MPEINWTKEARHAVRYSHDVLFPTHRGVTHWHDDVLLVFANDGYPPAYNCLQEAFKLRGIEVLGTATYGETESGDAYSIAMLVRYPNASLKVVEDCLWMAWNHHKGIENGNAFESIQRQLHGQA